MATELKRGDLVDTTIDGEGCRRGEFIAYSDDGQYADVWIHGGGRPTRRRLPIANVRSLSLKGVNH